MQMDNFSVHATESAVFLNIICNDIFADTPVKSMGHDNTFLCNNRSD